MRKNSLADNTEKAAVYARYSSDNQRDESIDGQLRAVEAYAKANGIEIVAQYIDRAKSATTDKRPQFQKMIADSLKQEFSMILVHKLDRFSRDKYDSVYYKRKLKLSGIRVISISERLDDSPESIMLESVIEGMAQYYSANLARETVKGLKENAYKALHTGGIPPLGYDVTPEKTYAINEAEAEIVQYIFDRYTNYESYNTIIDGLMHLGYKTKQGKNFGKNSLYSILNNEKYTGTYIYNKSSSKDAFGRRNSHKYKAMDEIIRIEGGMPQIVSRETFEKAQEILLKRKSSGGVSRAKRVYLLQGLIFCGECGSPMHGNSRKHKGKSEYTSYRCSNRGHTGTCSCKEVRKESVEEYVLMELEKCICNEKIVPLLVQKVNAYIQEHHQTEDKYKVRYEAQLTNIEQKIENIVDAISDGFAEASFRTKLQELNQQKTELEVLISKEQDMVKAQVVNEAKIRAQFDKIKDFVMSRNLPECKAFLNKYIHKVVVYSERIEVILRMPSEDGNDDTSIVKLSTGIDKKQLFPRGKRGKYKKKAG